MRSSRTSTVKPSITTATNALLAVRKVKVHDSIWRESSEPIRQWPLRRDRQRRYGSEAIEHVVRAHGNLAGEGLSVEVAGKARCSPGSRDGAVALSILVERELAGAARGIELQAQCRQFRAGRTRGGLRDDGSAATLVGPEQARYVASWEVACVLLSV